MLRIYRKGAGSTHTTAEDHIYPVPQKPWLGKVFADFARPSVASFPFKNPENLLPTTMPSRQGDLLTPGCFHITQVAPCNPKEATSELCPRDGPGGPPSGPVYIEVYKIITLLALLASSARQSLWDPVVIPARRRKWWHRGEMQLSAKAAGTLPRCSSPARGPRMHSCRVTSLLSSPKSSHHLCPPPPLFPSTHRLPTRVLPMCFGCCRGVVQGEGCCWFSCCLHGGDQLFLALFLNGVRQTYIRAGRSSCLDEYLPKSLCYLAVSLQKGPAPFVW